MKKLSLVLTLFSALQVSAQNYDLVVTTNGDSIACHIDSITDTEIHFEMKINERWVHTYQPISKCISHEFNAINESIVCFKPGSSYINHISASKLKANYYDLIITTEGDSIACEIDSITNSQVYFAMKIKDHWILTDIDKSEIIDYKRNAIEKKRIIFKPGTSYIARLKKLIDNSDQSLYGCRYLFAPSAFAMKKGTKRYTNIDLFVQDFQFGITDKFSICTGTSIFLNPVYIIPTYSFQINEKSAFAVGDLFLFTTYGDFLYGNLLYGMYTRGNSDNNFTIGAGLWISKLGSDKTETVEPGGPNPSFIEYSKKITTTSPAFNFSAQLKLSEYTYFVTENYWFKMNMDGLAELRDPSNNDVIIRSENYAIEETILAGIMGFRFINKSKPSRSWQLSSIYVLAYQGEIPDEYKQTDWETYKKENRYFFFPIPFISFTRNF